MGSVLFLLLLSVLLSCGGRKRDVAYYERMVDSIKRAERLKVIEQEAGMLTDPVINFFDTLRLQSLPIRSEGGSSAHLGHFSPVPEYINRWLGYPSDVDLYAIELPRKGKHPVVLIAEQVDSVRTSLYLTTLDTDRKVIDQLCIHDEEETERLDERGVRYTEYFITSDYHVSLISFFRSPHTRTPRPLETTKYFITEDGIFVEIIDF